MQVKISPACYEPGEHDAWALPFSTLQSAYRASQECSPTKQGGERSLVVKQMKNKNSQKGSEKCDYQNKDCYQKEGARPDDWNEEALGIKIVLAREALPVLSQKGVYSLSEKHTRNCIKSSRTGK
jgi:hypothetical protein